ncbi:MAG: hypothetical protein RR277_00655 [Rikenellaceae bacterium]
MSIIVIVTTMLLANIPPFQIFNTESKKTDILSDIKLDTQNITTISGIDSMMFVAASPLSDSINSMLLADSASAEAIKLNSGELTDSMRATKDSIVSKAIEIKIDSIVKADSTITAIAHNSPVVQIEDYTKDKSALNNFINALKTKDSRNVRIAFIGDSFIEGDILTGDVRELLQDEFGGRGVGFVPTTSISARYRTTIKHSFSNWTSYSIKKKNSTNIDNKFIISSIINTPIGDSAKISYKITNSKRNLTGNTKAEFFFINEQNTIINVVLNGSTNLKFTPSTSDLIQKIEISNGGEEIKTIDFRFKSTAGFYAYGITVNSPNGICVDNFSDRGSSGMQLLKLSQAQNSTFRKYTDYKLIVLQFGLNILTKGKNDYSYFENKMVDIVNNLKTYYPHASIIIMGISDRRVKVNNKYVAMSEINSLRKHQRAIAERTSVAYWDTYEAMHGKGGMGKFVDNRWAAADNIHVNVTGARVIAEQFVRSLKTSVSDD